ncbi:hypothetical protein MSAN_00085000 [Mycena sanguinolenta]|uniref:F-box domain-containing protein n=1 Tax=Mycena sanguinolenta TaxID=230812 RepID=A0A8H6ZCU2_9AGAR|nr:hypothetical protein MSAN_00085000 [Mycena sanguinolenta]
MSSSTLMPSPFASHLGTNYCPKDNELLEIRALLVEPTRRLQRLDDEIAELQKAIDKLAEERHILQTYVDGHKALVSPVRRLPLDIIQEIFVACIPTHRNCVMSASEAPVLLGRISSAWRAISLTMPRLWARLHIVEPPRGRYGVPNVLIDDKVTQRLDIMKMWLGRSGQCPLSISLQSGPDYDSPPATPTTSPTRSGQFLQELTLYAGRWQHIRVTALPFVIETIAHLTAVDVPMLKSAAFHPQLQFPPRVMNWEQFGFLGGPRLTSFSTTGNTFDPHSLPLRWNQLTQLTIGGPVWETSMTSQTLLQTLSQCNELRTCSLVVNDGRPSALSGPATESSQYALVELPFLHTFQLDCGSVPCTVLDRLSLPKLRDLTLHGVHSSLESFLGLCIHLEALSIDSNSFTKLTLQESLRALPPTMVHLTIRDIMHGTPDPIVASLDDDVLAVLTPAPGSAGADVPCPVLETLTITHCWFISDAALLRFVTERMPSPAAANETSDSASSTTSTLKRVDIQFNRLMTMDIMPSLTPFMEKGLDAEISYASFLTSHLSPWQGLGDVPAPSPWGFNGGW